MSALVAVDVGMERVTLPDEPVDVVGDRPCDAD